MATKVNKYTPSMVARIQEVAALNGGLDLVLSNTLAEEPEFVKAGVTGRGVVAKARTMGLPYRKVERLTKTGEPVVRKDEIVQAIEASLGLEGLDTLAKADKRALADLAAAIKNLTPVMA
ncbi:hypothetical protein EBZ38_07465 [bacterium]|nr:hypothetical protein [bacterium]